MSWSADRDPGAADAGAQKIERGEDGRDGKRQRQIVKRGAALQAEAEPFCAGDEDAVRSVRQPFRIKNDVIDDERERERCDSEIESLQAQGRNTNHDADQSAGDAGNGQADPDRQMIVREQDRIGIGADRQEASLAERNKPGGAGQKVQADRADHGDQGRDHQRQRIGADQVRRHDQRSDQRGAPGPRRLAVAQRDDLTDAFFVVARGINVRPARYRRCRIGHTAAPSARR